jgi:tripartite-type tricarboxylate transporter receptor subunit TctC
MRRWRHLKPWALAAAVLLAASGALSTAWAQAYPVKPVRMIVPFPPGGATDILARVAGQKLGEQLGQPVVIENRGGAGGNIGAELVAKAAPDGYTALFTTSGNIVVNPHLYRKMAFDPLRDLAPVAMAATHGNLVLVHPSLPVKSIKDLIAIARARPGQLNYGSGGIGTSPHLAAELFKVMTQTDLVHVPYKGGNQSVTGLLSGEVAVMFASIPSVLQHARSGRLRPLAITSAARSVVAPQLPTVAEAGVPGYQVDIWLGLFVPAGTPRDVITRLNAGIIKALNAPEVRERLEPEGFEASTMTPEEFGKHIRAELPVWARVVQAAKLRAD